MYKIDSASAVLYHSSPGGTIVC